MRRLASSVLYFEVLVVVFAIPVALRVNNADPAVAGIGAGVLIVGTILIASMLRHRWAYVAGSLLQVAMIASGVVVPPMYFLGALFAALWIAALWLGSRVYEPRPRQEPER